MVLSLPHLKYNRFRQSRANRWFAWLARHTGERTLGGAGESPVMLSDAIEILIQTDPHHLVEFGPHWTLELPAKQKRTKINISDEFVHYGAAISRLNNSVHTLLQAGWQPLLARPHYVFR